MNRQELPEPVRLRAKGAALAPLSGVTDIGFRQIAHENGAAFVVSEMVAADQLVRGEAEARLRAEGRGLAPHVVQLAGCDPDWMAEAARVAEGAGAHALDINMGCPAKRVINGWAGSALMRDLDHACRLIEATIGAVSIPVSVKMRLGWDGANVVAPALARRAEALGAHHVIVHARTRAQFYSGRADWRAVAPVSAAVRIPVIVNGDIDTPEAAHTALAQSGAAGVMVGRAALGRPWLVGMLDAALCGRALPLMDGLTMAQAAVRHYVSLIETMGRDKGLRHARKHVAAYADTAARLGAQHARGANRADALKSEDPTAVVAFLTEIFADVRPDDARSERTAA